MTSPATPSTGRSGPTGTGGAGSATLANAAGCVCAVRTFVGEAPDQQTLTGFLEAQVKEPSIAGGEIWIALDPKGMPVSMEEKLRGGDRKIAGAVVIDTLYQEDMEAVGAQLAKQFPSAEIANFRVLCQIGRGDL